MKTVFQSFTSIFLIFAGISVSFAQTHSDEFRENDLSDCSNTIDQFRPDLASAIDTVKCYRWMDADQEWLLNYLYINTYDEEGRLSETKTKYLNLQEMEWTNLLRNTFTYYPNDSLKTELKELWNPELDGGSWDNTSYDELEYDEADRLKFKMTYFSPYGSLELNPGNRNYYSYNPFNLVDTIITQYWNTNENEWFYSYRYRYYFDDEQRPAESYTDWSNNLQGDYLLNQRMVYLRDEDEQTEDVITQYLSQNVWMNSSRDHKVLNDLNLPDSVLFQQWNPAEMMWDTTVMELWLYDYNEAGLMTEFISQSYYIMFVNMQRQAYTYNGDNFRIESLAQQWNFSDSTWLNVQYCFYPQPVVTFSDETTAPQNEIRLYPNPAREFVEVDLNYPVSEPVKVELIKSNGKLVKEITLTNNNRISLTGLSPGLYFLRFSEPGRTKVEKLIIQ